MDSMEKFDYELAKQNYRIYKAGHAALKYSE